MSWSVQVTDADVDAAETGLRRGYAAFRATYHDADPALRAMDEQFEAAWNSARILILRGAVGDTGRYNVALSGHANPEHGTRSGYTNEVVSVAVSSAVPA